MEIKALSSKLAGLNRCPVCGGAKFPGSGSDARFACGASFSVSEALVSIAASEPCPVGSNVQADMLTGEVMAGLRGAA